MSDLKNWYLGGMVVAADKAEFKEEEHPRGKGGMFVKKGESGGGSSALEEVYKKGGFKNPDALAKADLEELGKMSDSRLDAEITMLKGKVEEGGKPLDKARLEAAEGIMKGRGGKKVDTKGKEVDLSAKALLVDAFKLGDSGVGGASHEKTAEMTLANWDTHSIEYAEKLLGMYKKTDSVGGWRANMYSALQTYIQDRKDLEKMDDVALGKAMADAINGKDKVRQHMIGEEQNRRYADKVSKMDDKELDDAVKSNESLVKKYGSGDDNPYAKSLEIAKAEKAKRGGQKVIKTKEEYSKTLEGFIKMENWGDDVSGISSVNKLKKIGDAPNYIIFAGKNGSEALKNRLEKLGLGVKETPNGNMQVFMK